MSSAVREASTSSSPLSVDRLLKLVSDPVVGGIALFIGVVRNRDEGADVVSLDYTQHPSAPEVLARCARQTAERYDIVSLAVEHRIGHLVVGDLAVVVAVGAVHRAEALAGLRVPDRHPQGRGADLEGAALRVRRGPLGGSARRR